MNAMTIVHLGESLLMSHGASRHDKTVVPYIQLKDATPAPPSQCMLLCRLSSDTNAVYTNMNASPKNITFFKALVPVICRTVRIVDVSVGIV